ncbi:glycoside hydrolase family 3 N-terminal domain-containing protein [Leptolyngbya ohadii]|uniref:glycoside hydrolase family 3 N-terminal domain-containing protein n=1 Tax=Leptolyngbya ohadii TaxID=1962290 RepID=UPI001CED0B78|nr:glycoside hydrolase family 3 N-terminal domain-containing protein [Leptolyngbya ohadii]
MTRIGLLSALPDWNTLSLRQQVAQMIVVRASGHLFDHQIEYPRWEASNAVLQRSIQELGVGGVILLGGSAAEIGLRTRQLQDWAEVPLLLCADIEEGVGQRFAGATGFPPPMALGHIARHDPSLAIDLAFQMGKITAQEAKAIGLNWVLAPVVDVNNNPANPVISVRSWGDTPEIVGRLGAAFIHGAQSFPVLTSAKHFPGHGDTAIDSHLDLPVIDHEFFRLQQTELPPFQQAIAVGVDSVMTAHLRLPALDRTYPATLSRSILTDLLRRQMRFDGLIVTDALIMGAILDRYGVNEAPVMAVEAGADVIMMPADPEGAIDAICEAVAAGRISQTQIEASLERIWRAKRKVSQIPITGSSTHDWERQPPDAIDLTQLASPEAIETATAILQHSSQIHRAKGDRLEQFTSNQLLEIGNSGTPRNLIVVDDALNSGFLVRSAPAVVLPSGLGYALQVVDRQTIGFVLAETNPPPTLLQVFLRANPFRDTAGLTQMVQRLIDRLLQPSSDSSGLLALVLYGSPYVLESLVAQLPPDLPYGFSYGQMPAAQAIVLNQLLGNSQQAAQPFTD